MAAHNPSFDPRPYEAAPLTLEAVQTEGGEYDVAPVAEAVQPAAPEVSPPPAAAVKPAAPATPAAPPPKPAGPNAFTARELTALVDDEDFKADIDAILGGQGGGAPRPQPKAPSAPPPTASAPPPSPEEAAAALDAEGPGEHAIFDKIARNMQFAKAYELAPVSLKGRFDNFDRQGPRAAPGTQRRATAAQMSPTVPATPPPVATPAPAEPVTPAPGIVPPRVQTIRAYTEEERVATFGDPRPDPEAWEGENIVGVEIPQLAGLPGVEGGRVRFHKLGAQALKDVFAAWEAEGQLSQIDGLALAYRAEPPEGPGAEGHRWGIAFDLAMPLPGSGPAPVPMMETPGAQSLAPAANRHGFALLAGDAEQPTSLHFELGHRL